MKITKSKLKQIIREEIQRETRKLNPRQRRSRRLAEYGPGNRKKHGKVYVSQIYANPSLFVNSRDGQEYFAKNPSADPEGDVRLVAGIMDDQIDDFSFRRLRNKIMSYKTPTRRYTDGRDDPQQTSMLSTGITNKGMDKKQAHEEALRLFPLYQAIYDFTEMTKGNEYHFEDGHYMSRISDTGIDKPHDWEPEEYNEEDEVPLYWRRDDG